ncbi:recombination protein RecR [Candidatus Saccharibacteria bacterium]|nr:recombination protein RecR [Candidatus Saccharibacteria bacterium]
MAVLPKALENLIEQLGKLSGVGPRTAERYALGILKRSSHDASELAAALENLHGSLKTCPKTFALIDASEDISPLYADDSRDKTLVAVVEDPIDIVALEKTGQFKGTYHVLGGVISPIDGIGPEQLHFNELIKRITDDSVAELILALNASVEGESTALYLQNMLDEAKVEVKVTRLARGLPVGIDLEYADQITLKHALQGRTQL